MTEKDKIMLLAETIQGEINRMCVTHELTELDSMFQHAAKNLTKLANMIYVCRFRKEESEEGR